MHIGITGAGGERSDGRSARGGQLSFSLYSGLVRGFQASDITRVAQI